MKTTTAITGATARLAIQTAAQEKSVPEGMEGYNPETSFRKQMDDRLATKQGRVGFADSVTDKQGTASAKSDPNTAKAFTQSDPVVIVPPKSDPNIAKVLVKSDPVATMQAKSDPNTLGGLTKSNPTPSVLATAEPDTATESARPNATTAPALTTSDPTIVAALAKSDPTASTTLVKPNPNTVPALTKSDKTISEPAKSEKKSVPVLAKPDKNAAIENSGVSIVIQPGSLEQPAMKGAASENITLPIAVSSITQIPVDTGGNHPIHPAKSAVSASTETSASTSPGAKVFTSSAKQVIAGEVTPGEAHGEAHEKANATPSLKVDEVPTASPAPGALQSDHFPAAPQVILAVASHAVPHALGSPPAVAGEHRPAEGATEPAANAAGEDVRTIASTPGQLEVGVVMGTHGWLRVRTTLDEGGTVSAQVIASSVNSADSLHKELPSLTAYLAQEHVAISSVVVNAVQHGDAMQNSNAGTDQQSTFQARSGGQPGSPPDSQSDAQEQRQTFGAKAYGLSPEFDPGGSPTGLEAQTFKVQAALASGRSLARGGWVNVRV